MASSRKAEYPHFDPREIRDASARKAVAQYDRKTLEDKFFEIVEDNMVMKKKSKVQNDKMKRMGTKLLKLESEAPSSHMISVERSEVLEDLQERVQHLEKENTLLKNKLTVIKYQDGSRGRRSGYEHIGPRISSGITHKSPMRPPPPQRGGKGSSKKHMSTQVVQLPQYGHSLLDQARKENLELEEHVLKLKSDIKRLELQLEQEREEFKYFETEFETEKLTLIKEIDNRNTNDQKHVIDKDVTLIRIQRDLREKTSQVDALRSQLLVSESTCVELKERNSELMKDLQELNRRFDEEFSKKVLNDGDTVSSTVSQRTISELQEMISDLKQEKDLLKETNERLLKNALDPSRDERYHSKIQQLQKQVQDEIAENGVLRCQYSQLQVELQDAQIKLDHLTRAKNGLPLFEATPTQPIIKEDTPTLLEVQELRMKLSERSHDSQHKQSIIEQQSALIRTLKYELNNKITQLGTVTGQAHLSRWSGVRVHTQTDPVQKESHQIQTEPSPAVDRQTQTKPVATRSVRLQVSVLVDKTVHLTDHSVQTDQPTHPAVTLPHPTTSLTHPTTSLTHPTTTPSQPVPTPTHPVPTPSQPIPTPTQLIPTPSQPIPTPSQPIPTPSQPIPTPSQPIPTPSQPIPTPSQPIPTPSQPIPTPSQLIPTPTQPVPTPTQPIPTPTHPIHSLTRSQLAISIINLTINPDSSVAKDPNIQLLFVEYEFLDYNGEEMETPSLLKIPTGEKMVFDFRQVFSFDFDEERESYELLRKVLLSSDQDVGRIEFLVVCDPGNGNGNENGSEDGDGDCEEVGMASVDIRKIVTENKDLIRIHLPVYGTVHEEVIGTLEVSIEGRELFSNILTQNGPT